MADHEGRSPEKLIRGVIDETDKAKQALISTIEAYRDQHGNIPTISDMQHLAKKIPSHVQKKALQFIHSYFNACREEVARKPANKPKL